MRDHTIRRLIRNLLEVSLLVGIISTLSFGAEIQNLLRAMAPGVGAWWSDYQFYFMAGAATAFGLLAALRLGLRLVDPESHRRLALAALALDAMLIVPLSDLCAAVARVDAGGSVVTFSRFASFAGYAGGKLVDKLIVAGVYFLKIAAFGFLFGLALFGAVMVMLIFSPNGGGRIASAQASQVDPK